MKSIELKKLTESDLEERLSQQEKQLLFMRLQKSLQQTIKTHHMRSLRKTISRIKTILHEQRSFTK